jgi:hypothetical protein
MSPLSSAYIPPSLHPLISSGVRHVLISEVSSLPLLLILEPSSHLSTSERLLLALISLKSSSSYSREKPHPPGEQTIPVYALLIYGTEFDMLRWDGSALSRVQSMTVDFTTRGKYIQGMSDSTLPFTLHLHRPLSLGS